MPISLKNAAKYYKELSHQIAAWNFLEGKIPEDILDEFAEIYRASPEKVSTKIITPDVMQKLTGYAAHKFDATFCADFNKLLTASGFDKHEGAMCMLVSQSRSSSFIFFPVPWMNISEVSPHLIL